MKKLLLFLLLLNGCATQGVDRSELNVIKKEFYASIISMKEVKLSSEVNTGIVGGASIGVIDELDGNHEDMIAGALAGAIVGGLFTAIFEGSNKAFEYTLRTENNDLITIIQKEKVSVLSECVKVKIASKVSVVSASKEKCQFI
ncbi:hypothetical protein CMT41_08030 [Colwellia sp. MT41]|uniref:hypothetical protein n=1 Tax=Colwellia sp. MT41 TaxID=58049 RepID=UPI0007177577|nr:hypothetical protein [Colwellia sp. MT41]ALO34673.1 hypothetical protein CMT41_08030 [Colwellia sp. MT41]